MTRATAIIWALLAGVALVPAAAASPGDLDGSFSGDGWLRTLEVRSSTNNYLPRGAEDVAVQPDGRVVAVGELIDGGSSWYFGAFRYLPNAGSRLPSGRQRASTKQAVQRQSPSPATTMPPFGEGGVVRTPFGLVHASRAFDVSVGPDGRIVAAGFVQKGGDGQDSSHFAVARYQRDGRLDQSFSRDGIASVDFGYGNDVAYAVAHGPRGRIVVAGQGTRNRYRTEDDFAFARFRPDGRLDRGFSGDGRRTVNFGGRRFDGAFGLAIRGRSIFATGSTVVAPERAPSVAVARLTWGGGLARGFGRRRIRPSPGGGIGRAVAIEPGASGATASWSRTSEPVRTR